MRGKDKFRMLDNRTTEEKDRLEFMKGNTSELSYRARGENIREAE